VSVCFRSLLSSPASGIRLAGIFDIKIISPFAIMVFVVGISFPLAIQIFIMMQLSATLLVLSSLLAGASAQTVVATTPNATAAATPKPTDKDLALILHVFNAGDNKAHLISRGKLPDTVGSKLTLVTDLTEVEKGAPRFVLNGDGFGSTGGGALGNKTKVYSVPDDALTVNMAECADIQIALNFTNKELHVLKLFAVIGGGEYIVLPNITGKKVGDLMEGKAVIDDVEGTGLAAVFDKVPDGTACSVSWVNGNGKKQTLKLIIGKSLKTVNTIIGICVTVMAALAAVTMFYVINVGK
jgi:hypothetical protein